MKTLFSVRAASGAMPASFCLSRRAVESTLLPSVAFRWRSTASWCATRAWSAFTCARSWCVWEYASTETASAPTAAAPTKIPKREMERRPPPWYSS